MRQGREVSIKIRVAAIRDGSQGISIALPDELLGEWPDSGASSLTITDEYKVRILGEDGVQRYLLTMPGIPVRGEQLSDIEAVIVVCL
jgi:hypothetical protein